MADMGREMYLRFMHDFNYQYIASFFYLLGKLIAVLAVMPSCYELMYHN